MRTRLAAALLTAVVFAGFAPAAFAQTDNIPGQKTFPILQDSFQFVPGTWAEYTVLDKAKSETYRMWIAALAKETIQGQTYSWLEIEVEMKDTPVVVTSILAEETKNGPGRIEKAVVQVRGMSPFTIPRKYLEGQEQTVGEFKPAHIVRKLESRKIDHKGAPIDVLAVEAENDNKERVSAAVSLQLPPIAIYEAETSELKMTANDWGGGAQTKIEGAPIPFFLWLIEAVADGLTKKK